MENALRIGNDANFAWSVKRIVEDPEHPGQTTKVPYDLTGRNLRLWLVGRVDKIEVTDFTVNANVISWTFFGKDQKHTGIYNALLCENMGEERMVTVDIQYAVTLVPHSWQENAADNGCGCGCVNMETIQLESTVAMEPGPRGYSAYEIAVQNGFEGTVQEWLESLGINTVIVTVGNNTGVPYGTATIVEQTMALFLDNIKGEPGIGNITAEELPGTAPLLVNPSNYWTKAESDARYLGGGGTVTVDDALSTTSTNPVQNKVITNALNGKQATIEDLATIRSGAAAGAAAYQKPVSGIPASDLASGVIPDVSGFYTKPGTGIPSTDLAAAVQASLALADSALQSFTETDPTVPSWAKQPSKPTYTAQEVGALPASTPIPSDLDDLSDVDGTTPTDGQVLAWNATASKWKPTTMQGGGSVTVDSALSDTSENPVQNKVVKAAVDAKQDVIDSTNKLPYAYLSGAPTIPTIPTALSSFTDDLGSSPTHTHSQYLTAQDISGKQDKSTITSSADATGSITLADNTEFRFTNAALTSLTIALPASIGDRLDAWISFNSGSTATSATYPNTIKWSGDDVNNNVFVPAASKTYNIGIWYDGINVNAVARSV